MNGRSMAVLPALLMVCSTLMAAPAQKQSAEPNDGVKAAVDAKGQLRQPTADELRQLETQSKSRVRFDKSLKVRTLSNGAVGITLDERYDLAFVAMTDADGNLVFACVDGPDQADAIVTSVTTNDTIMRIKPAPVAKPQAERE